MTEFKSLEKFKISGRGDVYVVPNPDLDFTQQQVADKYLGQMVLIDGQQFKCTGIETMGMMSRKNGLYIGMLTRPAPKAPLSGSGVDEGSAQMNKERP